MEGKTANFLVEFGTQFVVLNLGLILTVLAAGNLGKIISSLAKPPSVQIGKTYTPWHEDFATEPIGYSKGKSPRHLV